MYKNNPELICDICDHKSLSKLSYKAHRKIEHRKSNSGLWVVKLNRIWIKRWFYKLTSLYSLLDKCKQIKGKDTQDSPWSTFEQIHTVLQLLLLKFNLRAKQMNFEPKNLRQLLLETITDTKLLNYQQCVLKWIVTQCIIFIPWPGILSYISNSYLSLIRLV